MVSILKRWISALFSYIHFKKRSKMRLLFIVTSFWAYGELQIAMDFATGMKNAGNAVQFLIPPSHTKKVESKGFSYQVLIPNAGKLNRILFQDIELTYQPTHIVLSDFLNYAFCERHYGVTEKDITLYSGLIGTFDLYDFALAGKQVDTYGFRAKEMAKLNIDSYDFLLQPCPVNQTDSKKNANIFRYRMFQDICPRTEEEKEKARTFFKIAEEEKIILMTGAVWQSSFRPYAKVKQIVETVDNAVLKLIEGLPKTYKIYWIGPRCSPFSNKDNRIKQIDSLPAEQFEMLADAADVFLSMNYISTSMVRAALHGIPVVLLGNSFVKRDGKQWSLENRKNNSIVAGMEEVYPFRMFPVGWYSFLKPTVQKNSFYQLTKCTEIFETTNVIETVKQMACMNFEQCQFRLENYKQKWNLLPTVQEFKDFMECEKIGADGGNIV